MSRVKSLSTLVVVLGFIGWAKPLRAQALDLPLNSNLFSSIGVFSQQLQATGGTPPYVYSFTPGASAPGSASERPALPTFPCDGTGGLLAVFRGRHVPDVDSRRRFARATVDRPTVNVLPTAIH